MTVVLGIDPGSRITGYGIVHKSKYKLTHLGSGCINTKLEDFSSRLKLIYNSVNKIITQFKPDFFAIEKVFLSKNVSSAFKLGQAQSVATIVAINENIPVSEYSACQIKKTVTGIGNAKKNQVQNMVKILLHLSAKPQVDASDALAIAITHCFLIKNVLS